MSRGRGVVVSLCEGESESGRRPIHHRRAARQGLDVDPLPVHAVEAKIQIDELLVEGIDDSFGSNRVAACRARELCSLGRAVAFEQFEPVCGIPMSMDIDDAGGRGGA